VILVGFWLSPLPNLITRYIWKGKDFIYSTHEVPFFGASSPGDAAQSLLVYWVEWPMLCLGLWDGETDLTGGLPEWVVVEMPTLNQSMFPTIWMRDETIKVIEKMKLDGVNGNMWFLVAEGTDNFDMVRRISCLVNKEGFGRWKVHDPGLLALAKERARRTNGE
jgi:hypothetical protein